MLAARRDINRVLALLAVCTVACAPAPRTPPPESFPPLPPEVKASGQLAVFITDQTTDGRNLKLRGLVANPYDLPIAGVRLVFRIMPTAEPTARELDRFQKVMNAHLAPLARVPLSWDIQSMYAGQSGRFGFTLQAFAITRGDESLPLPPGWKDQA